MAHDVYALQHATFITNSMPISQVAPKTLSILNPDLRIENWFSELSLNQGNSIKLETVCTK